MPRPNNKRKAGEIDFDEPMSYVLDYCRRHGLPEEAGQSAAEKECAQRAADAREDYKSKRDAAAFETSNANNGSGAVNGASSSGYVPDDRNDRKGLSPAQKYTIRLQNNRKSAYASKVYNEVLKRELSHRFQKTGQPDTNPKPRDDKRSHAREKEYQQRCKALEQELKIAREELLEEKRKVLYQLTRNGELSKSLKALEDQEKEQEKRLLQQEEDARKAQRSPSARPLESSGSDALATPDREEESALPSSVPSQRARSQTTVIDKSESPDELRLRSAAINVLSQHVIQFPKIESQTQTPSATQQDTIAPSEALSLHQRAISSGISSGVTPFTFSHNESDGRDFHSGLTFSQSQNDDTDDKAQLMRNLPSSGGIPVNLMCSQPSQSDLPPYKSSLGSEDMAIGDAENLYNSSQGTPSGRPRKAARTS